MRLPGLPSLFPAALAVLVLPACACSSRVQTDESAGVATVEELDATLELDSYAEVGARIGCAARWGCGCEPQVWETSFQHCLDASRQTIQEVIEDAQAAGLEFDRELALEELTFQLANGCEPGETPFEASGRESTFFGTAELGDACWAFSRYTTATQCRPALTCSDYDDAGVGTCVKLPELGEACRYEAYADGSSSSRCDQDLTCIDGSCAALPGEGDACDRDVPCASPLSCAEGRCEFGYPAECF